MEPVEIDENVGLDQVAATMKEATEDENEPIESTESATLPLVAPPKTLGKAGRKPKMQAPEPRDAAKYFPTPPTRTFQDTNATTRLRVQGFIDYARHVSTDNRFAGRAYFTIYRLWPVINRLPPKKRQIDNTDKYLDSVQELYHRYGSGDYQIFMNDTKDKTSKEICRCFVKGYRNLNEDPPVFDLEDLVVTDPSNASYLAWRRTKGLSIPGEDPQPRNGDEEMSKELATALLDRNDRLTDQLVTMAHEREHVDYHPGNGGMDAAASTRVLDVMTAGAKSAIEMTQSAAKKATEVQAQQADPIDGFTRLAAAVQTLFPQQDNSALLKLIEAADARASRLEDRLAEEQRDRMASLEQRLIERATAAPAAPPKSFTEELRERVEVQKLLKELAGPEEDEEETGLSKRSGKDPWYAPFVPLAIPVGMFAINSLATMVHNLAVSKTGTGVPQAPPPVPADGISPEMRQQLNPGDPGANARTHRADGQPLSPQEEQMNQVRGFIQAIKQPIMTHLNDPEADGHDFAVWMINGYGMVTYKQVTGTPKAKDEITNAIRAHAPDLWDVMQRLGPAADQFLTEFIEGPRAEDDGEAA
jgi:hypothetical protein